MITPSEYIQIIGAGIYATALFYTILTFKHTKRLDQISLSNNIFNELRNLDLEIAKIPLEPKYDDVRNQWYSRMFNSINWLSFLINEKVINDKKMIEHFKPIIVKYYEDIFIKSVSIEEQNFNSYSEFKKLYRAIKK